MTNAAPTPETKSHLLDIKRQLEKAQSEVDQGKPEIGLHHIEAALETVYPA